MKRVSDPLPKSDLSPSKLICATRTHDGLFLPLHLFIDMDIWINVSAFIPSKSLHSLSCCSHSFKQKIWKTITDLDLKCVKDSVLQRFVNDSVVSGGKLTHLNIERDRLTDEGVAAIAKLTALRSLNLNAEVVTDNGTKSLSTLEQLQFLTLDFPKSSPLEFMPSMTCLHTLCLVNYPACLELQHLVSLRSLAISNLIESPTFFERIPLELTRLEFICESLANSEFQLVSKFTNLKCLISHCNNISNFKPLSYLTNLERLELTSYDLNDDEMVSFESLTKLRWLSLQCCEVTNVGVESIVGLESLTSLELHALSCSFDALLLLKNLTNLQNFAFSPLEAPTEHRSLGYYLEPFTRLTDFTTQEQTIHPQDLESLTILSNLQSLDLQCSQFEENATYFFMNLTNLRYLNLAQSSIKSTDLPYLASLQGLTVLDLSSITFQTTEYLVPLLQSLTALTSLDIMDHLLEELIRADEQLQELLISPQKQALVANIKQKKSQEAQNDLK